ncbi:MAG: protein-export chaperone SecB [Bacteroidia bacterium]|nr:protein-export chaperone SecB [Bacteroidia bacterium]
MNEPVKAVFGFENFKIVSFSLNEPSPDNEELNIIITPSGIYYENDGNFEVTIDFAASETNNIETAAVKAVLKARFIFEEPIPFSEIPNYFYLNSIAIVFPYLRAFISSLTLQANIKTIILPVLNLTGLDQPLRDNTKVVKE